MSCESARLSREAIETGMKVERGVDMNTKAGLYAVIGGVVGAVLTMAVCSVMPVGAQNGDTTFGVITCTGLKVVDAEGNPSVTLMDVLDDGMVVVNGKAGGGVILHVNDHGGRVDVFSKAIDNDYGRGDDFSTQIDRLHNAIRASMGVNEYGNGAVDTWDKNGYRLATLK